MSTNGNFCAENRTISKRMRIGIRFGPLKYRKRPHATAVFETTPCPQQPDLGNDLMTDLKTTHVGGADPRMERYPLQF